MINLYLTMDKLRNRYGKNSVGRAISVISASLNDRSKNQKVVIPVIERLRPLSWPLSEAEMSRNEPKK